ncbi:MAG: hypothetical protein SGPRY_005974 [Prymnesium sp.]
MPAAGLTRFKLFAAGVVFAAAWGGVMLPRLMSRRASPAPLSLASLLSGGVMLGAGLLHLLPDATESLGGEYPFANVLFAVGLVVPMVVEKLAHSSSQRKQLLSAEAQETNPDMSDEEHPATFSPMLVMFALSFHSVLEGLAQGAATSLAMSFELLLVIILHKGLAAFALGCVFVQSAISRQRANALGLIFASATPVGIVVGLLLHVGLEGETWVACAIALASGSFCFVALQEVIPAELNSRRAPIAMQLSALSVGFTAMAVLAVYV